MDTERFLSTLGHQVRHRRVAKGLTLKALSAASGVSERYLSSLESGRGNISVGRLFEVAAALGCSVRALIPGPTNEGPAENTRGRLIALLGLRGAGKTSVGARLAQSLALPFYELDALVEEEAELNLEQIFAIHGEVYYRRLETSVLEGLLRSGERAVVATGGGIVTAPEAYGLLLRQATTLWLKAEPEDHWQRVLAQGDQRPMADNPHAMAELRAILEQRTPLYARASVALSTHDHSIEQVVAEAQRALNQMDSFAEKGR